MEKEFASSLRRKGKMVHWLKRVRIMVQELRGGENNVARGLRGKRKENGGARREW